MRIIYIKIFFFIYILSTDLFAQTIGIVNIQFLIDNNFNYKDTLDKIEDSRLKYLNDFNLREKEFSETFDQIENSKLILSQNEVNIQIDNYNTKLNNFKIEVEEFNFHYQNQILLIRETVFKEIIKILEEYATKKNIDLILDSNSYLIASNSLDITMEINNILRKKNFKLEYQNFEKN